MDADLVGLSACEQRRLLGAGEVSARELLAAHVERIEAVNDAVNAIVAFDPSVGAARAAAVDDAVAAGEPLGPLAGLVTAHKDLTETAAFPTAYGSPLLAGFRPSATATMPQARAAAAPPLDPPAERARS